MRGLRWWAAGYAVVVATILWSMAIARNRVIERLSTPQSVAQWQHWRDDVKQQQTAPGPVQRRVPFSTEPPALVLMRDYFPVSLAGALLFITALYWVIVWFLTGMLTPSK